MKRIYTIACLSMLFIAAQAQFEKGNMLIEGSFYWSGTSTEAPGSNGSPDKYERKYNNLKIDPSLGYFVSESILVGFGLSYSSVNSRWENEYERYDDYEGRLIEYNYGSVNKTNLISFNPYITKYHQLSEKLYFNYTFNFLVGFAGETSYNFEYENNDEEENNTYYWYDDPIDIFEIGLNITPGLTYFLNEKFAVNCNVGQIYYSKNVRKPAEGNYKPKTVKENFGLNLELNTFMLGFQYYIR